MKNIIFYLLVGAIKLIADGVPDSAIKPLNTTIAWLGGTIFVGVLTLALIFAGYTYVFGNKEKGKELLINLSIGGVLVLSAAAIAALFN